MRCTTSTKAVRHGPQRSKPLNAASRRSRWSALVAIALLAGCFEPDVPGGVAVSCVIDAECPAGFVCATALARCVNAADFGDLCGDGALGGDEECDDGADNDDERPDACRSDCRRPRCGDGTKDEGEACDDGIENDDTAADACRTTCALPSCGDGVQDADEACDDGVDNSDVVADACRTNCGFSSCGDGVKDAGEECDDGVDNDNLLADACRTTCLRPACGDGTKDEDEACDDGNVDDGDGCRGDCAKVERCGDGVVDRGEACDDGNDNPVDGCAACSLQGWSRDVVVSGAVEGRAAVGFPLTPTGIDIDDVGRIFVADAFNRRVFRLDVDGTMTVVADSGEEGSSEDGVRATSARLTPADIAVDGRGRLLIAEGARLRRVEADGVLTTIAGTGATPGAGDGARRSPPASRPSPAWPWTMAAASMSSTPARCACAASTPTARFQPLPATAKTANAATVDQRSPRS